MAPVETISSTWKKYVEGQQGFGMKHNSDNDGVWYELEYKHYVLKYRIAVFGPQPPTGYSLYIGLHGGGQDKISSNDASWKGFFNDWYRGAINDLASQPGRSGGVYVATRGISALNGDDPSTAHDTFDLHSQPESYLLMQRMIMNLLLPQPQELKQLRQLSLNKDSPQFIDPDRVYLLGFSAGGDGVYQLTSKMADRFAAAVAGGGHPNQATFCNLANMPICLQSGERDIVSGGGNKWLRSRSTIETASRRGLPESQLVPEYSRVNSDDGIPSSWYHYECHIIKDGDHNGWANTNSSQKVLTNLAAWYAESDKPARSMNPGARDIVLKNINAVNWASQFTRNSCPGNMVWDLSSRSPPYPDLDQPKHLHPERFFHWLYIRDTSAPDYKADDVVFANYGWNYVRIKKPTRYIGLLLNESMIPFDRWFEILCEDTSQESGYRQMLQVQPHSIKPSDSISADTLSAKGDPKLIFSAMIFFEPTGDGGWNARYTTESSTLQKPA